MMMMLYPGYINIKQINTNSPSRIIIDEFYVDNETMMTTKMTLNLDIKGLNGPCRIVVETFEVWILSDRSNTAWRPLGLACTIVIIIIIVIKILHNDDDQNNDDQNL